ncbi:NAD(P)H-dependent oxidoreductase [Methyloversatilis sp.]|uniref:NAD(P)H-dependent oxidoreductase n=1 Tax=Methyloversatilis sp. TaxID=2569862 RepID=UPI0027360C2E|nr:NAD(P)H-dependent oxidoreductase [Methyloversatilis sp.]MDP2870335.1 NAD(P)H-dependent oxidoreductase [Methyloversatilis sp.]MDP3454412.1 NAD(P)H-dependent oxidoreductase [Methyloversatilis sp.]MDP3577903.1 NAD(P)H-dependent oxidoreductase [Methyloversatilis sp.]
MGRIVVIQGHPETRPGLLRALADSYIEGAREAGHEVETIDVTRLQFPLLRDKAAWSVAADGDVARAQAAVAAAQHVAVFFPLWLGTLPALLKAFFEQLFRPGFAIGEGTGLSPFKPLLKGRSARLVVTMGMPALMFRWIYLAHGVKSFERNALNFVGIRPVRTTLVGSVDSMNDAARARWHAQMRGLGRAAR